MSTDTMPVVVDEPRATNEPEHIRTRFGMREFVQVKGLWFEVQDIGEKRLVLKPRDNRGW